MNNQQKDTSMLTGIYSFNRVNPIKFNNQNDFQAKKYSNLSPLNRDTVSFTGLSDPSLYKTVFDYLAADIVSKHKGYKVNGSMLSSKNIQKAVEELYTEGRLYAEPVKTSSEKIKWKDYVPQDVRTYCANKINDAREQRFREWKTFLENPDSHEQAKMFPELTQKLKKNKSLRLVVWHSVNSELKANNRHIPVPFDIEALDTTVKGYESISTIDRKIRCTTPTFIEVYTHRLRDNLMELKGLGGDKPKWVKIPSKRHDPKNNMQNIRDLEILSNRNWCTRSSVDKAEAALEDGDFYLYLTRDAKKMWKPTIGMASAKGKIDQIQGMENNNLIPLTEYQNVSSFIKNSGLKCNSGIFDEGPKATQQLYVAQKLLEQDALTGKTLDKAIKDCDNRTIFSILGKKPKQDELGMLEIENYKPTFVANGASGITVPYSMMNINEDAILSNVRKINGDMVLHNKNALFSSSITEFPKNLEEVQGRIICSPAQYEKFAEDIDRIIGNNKHKLIIQRG